MKIASDAAPELLHAEVNKAMTKVLLGPLSAIQGLARKSISERKYFQHLVQTTACIQTCNLTGCNFTCGGNCWYRKLWPSLENICVWSSLSVARALSLPLSLSELDLPQLFSSCSENMVYVCISKQYTVLAIASAMIFIV